jgi:secondary thiamine-phosphate synthase enzyme
MIQQQEIAIGPFRKGIHSIDRLIINTFENLPQTWLLHIFVKHTSAGIMLNENADPDVLTDIDLLLKRLAPEGNTQYRHTLEGLDDMPAHFKSLVVGSSVTIPITNHKLNLGTWQGIHFCEFRNHGDLRKLVCTLYA